MKSFIGTIRVTQFGVVRACISKRTLKLLRKRMDGDVVYSVGDVPKFMSKKGWYIPKDGSVLRHAFHGDQEKMDSRTLGVSLPSRFGTRTVHKSGERQPFVVP